ncbi:GNAT family N-acetyltransferase [Alteromonadaceae bacterium BrNp21-10]|nr:GNAT family N-acetyltransferase [Alteromonadaceae bacterium BrNp21-10]
MNSTAITTYYLEMNSPNELKPKLPVIDFKVMECMLKQFHYNKFMYQFVGEHWQWHDKLSWSDEQWQNYAESDQLRIFIGYYQGSPAGYYELQQQANGNVEIMYFGLGKTFIGKGLGGYLLTHAINSAWQWQDTQRVWVHTCSLDHPSALANYQARGFQVYKTEPNNGDQS